MSYVHNTEPAHDIFERYINDHQMFMQACANEQFSIFCLPIFVHVQ